MPALLPGSPSPGRPLVAVFGVMLALSLWFTTRAWHASILDRHEFRQVQTAVSAYWIKADGFRLDYETPLFGPPWSIPFEFPIYQWCVATASRLCGTGLEPTARGVSLFFFLAMLPAVYGLAGLLPLAPSRRLLVVSSVLASPTYLFYARSFMIETTALCFASWFLYAVTRAVRDNHGSYAVAAAIFAVLAGLAKVTTFAVFLAPAALLTWLHWRTRWAGRSREPAVLWRVTAFAIVPVLAGLAISYGWVRHGDNLKQSNPFAGFLRSAALGDWTWGTWEQRVSGEFWKGSWTNISGLVLGVVPLVGLLLCAGVVAPVYRRAAAWCVAFFVGAMLTFSNLYFIHDYYYCANAVFLLAGAGFLLAGVWESPRLPTLVKWLAIVLVLGGQLRAYYTAYGPYQRRELPAPPALAAVVRAVVPAENVVVIYGWDWNALLPYYAQRRVIMVPYGREPETKVLDEILHRVPPGRVSALIIRNDDTLNAKPGFVRERLNHFNLAPVPFATSADGDLYLPEEQFAAAAARIQGQSFNGVMLNLQPAADPYAGQLQEADLGALALPMTRPRPVRARGMMGVGLGSDRGRTVLLAHPASEIHFTPPVGATRIDAEVGMADAAFATENSSPTDGVTVEIFEFRPGGRHRTLFRRDLDPARLPADRGVQAIHVDGIEPFAGIIVFRITPGPNNNFNSDWAYWSHIEIR